LEEARKKVGRDLQVKANETKQKLSMVLGSTYHQSEAREGLRDTNLEYNPNEMRLKRIIYE
jgi:hypothetical protein